MKEDLLKYMEDGQNSIIIATHLQEEVKEISDYICVIDKGKLIHQFEKDEVRHFWARLWVSSVPVALKEHPNVIEISEVPIQIVTDNLPDIEEILHNEQITITHMQRLNLDEVITYCLDKEWKQ